MILNNRKDITMSKTGQWLLQMQEDAEHMTKKEFINEHGEHNVDLYDKVQNSMDLEHEQSERNLEQFQDAQGEGY